MEIIIHDSFKLSEIQETFHHHFPFLKIEFFTFLPNEEKVYSKSHMIKDTHLFLRDVRHIHFTGHVSINGHQKVRTLENKFKELYGLDIQVFRKAGDTWLQTIQSDESTLSELNSKGLELNSPSKQDDSSEFEAYHEQE